MDTKTTITQRNHSCDKYSTVVLLSGIFRIFIKRTSSIINLRVCLTVLGYVGPLSSFRILGQTGRVMFLSKLHQPLGLSMMAT
uniref:Ovule protein n=1 Tax=Strongyloides venezuelensis TaxID=75913 RepID=A0A0K0G5G7_STRVS